MHDLLTSPRVRLRRRGADKHPLILKAARTLIAQSGFREAQMTAIAEAAGLAIGTLYRYFPSKTELLVEVVKFTAQREVDVVAGIAMRDGTACDRLGIAAWTFASRALRGRRLAHALVAEPVEPEVEAARLTYHRALSRVFRTIIEQGIAAGEFPEQDSTASADCIVGCLFEGLVAPLSSEAALAGVPMQSQATSIITFCLRGVAGTSVTFVPPA
ncbi:transcriptional regulator TetR family (plasmid) [Cupriavidus necator N-1]|jgi:AcrR family transcriptional regulator|uniref:Transcriptional regulator TetR family n=1 Tax=Cupriavidus necator (strain ATCC 43291 / DSM 13513 / CCUG 52238 / LMG 8453 / N-1) TaxID=1042878 RepID=F8GWA9_CUPNN|nr:TetR/AcrR family transcriptional regulator [Cupriavidus necator]AEI81684.1 transcriptional regulator TetR family [Cupriavidus necator N-1]MDX6008037.1 TetR/AcrR family transcriptional regulator [Cupriavidus necator]